MIAWFKSWFTPLVDDVVAEFHKVVAKLEKVADFHTKLVAVHDEEISFRLAAKAAAEREVAKARKVAAKLKDLLSA